MTTCDAEWSTSFDDTYYGLAAACDLPSGHSGQMHQGSIRRVWGWSGSDDDALRDIFGVKVTWPGTLRDTPEG